MIARAHPLTMFGFDALIAGAARLRPGRVALRDIGAAGVVDHAELDRRIEAFRDHLRGFGFEPGERALIVCGADARTLVAFIGAIAAGLEPLLAPLGIEAGALAGAARVASAAALIAPTTIGDESLEELLLGVAAQAPSIRLIGALGPGVVDGAVDLGVEALAATEPPPGPDRTPPSRKVAIGTLDRFGAPHFHEQGALLASSLALVAKARVSGAAPLVSLVSPASVPGLVAGPLASLLSGAPLHLLSPFDAGAFLAHLDATGPCRLVVPRAILPELDAAGLLTSGAVAACIAVLRPGDLAPAFEPRAGACPIVEIGENGALRAAPAPQRRELYA